MEWARRIEATRNGVAAWLRGEAAGIEEEVSAARRALAGRGDRIGQTAYAKIETAFAEANPGATAGGTPLAGRGLAEWDEPPWTDHSPSTAPVGTGGLVRLGRMWPARASTAMAPHVSVPAVVPLLGSRGLLVEGRASAVAEANALLQSVVWRLLAAVAPGRLRLVCMDAQGLGNNLAHLLELSELIRGPKVWHEPGEIEAALDELSQHMSMVIQKYLRNAYASLDAYNREAGEVAEAWRLVVVAGFPAGFREATARRLLDIARNGPRVGVHVLASLDESQPLPRGFPLSELREHMTVVQPLGGGWGMVLGAEKLALRLDQAPPRPITAGLAAGLNPAATQAGVVQVPFEAVLPREPWNTDSAAWLEVPIGRRGARELVRLSFGRHGTAHHALIGGRTGSGKTVLLHVIISALATWYAPGELQLYLVDFKEGVEFQVYRDLPHVAVLAIQSEREFGLSVLEGLRKELERRGELFTERHVADLPAWRDQAGPGDEHLPRIVLLVDEFQVFFERRDAMGSRARALITDLVRRGRSFGIHLILAS